MSSEICERPGSARSLTASARTLKLLGALAFCAGGVLNCSTSSSQPIGMGGSPSTGGQVARGGDGPNAGSGSGGTSGGSAGGALQGGGGALAQGGAAAGGASRGGSTAQGGVNAQGGVSARGGANSQGGVSAQGGVNTQGGVSGGSANQGGSAGAKAQGGSANQGGSSSYSPCPSAGTPCKIMPFGDSITDGYTVAGGYRIELFRLAHQAGKSMTFVGSGSNGPTQVDGVAFPSNHEGHSGYTINDETSAGRMGLAPLVSPRMKTYTPHIVLLMVGTNDVNLNINLANAPTRLAALIDSIFNENPNVMLVVAELTPTRDDAVNDHVQTYNSAIPALVKARADAGRHIALVDMYAAVTANASYKTALLADTLHPNTAGYVVLGQTFYQAVANALH